MGLKCRISYSASGQAMVTDANGNASKLFADALAVTQDQNAALNIWASAYTPEFQETFGTTSQTEEPAVLQVVKYYQSLKQLDGRLEPKELFEVRQMMRTSGISNLSDFSSTLKAIFLQGDVPGIDENLAIESGLFLPEDLNSIDLPKVVDLIARMEGETLSNDFEVEPQDSEILYRDTAHKNIFGASETVTIEQIDSEVIDLIDNFQSEEEFYNKLQELPYSDFTARFYEDEAFANEYMAKFQGLVKVPVIEERAGELVSDVTPTFSTVKNTILDGLDSITIDADISFINSIADNIWEANAETVSSVVQEIEAELATKNIDIIGLHSITTDKATLLEMLNAASVMVENPTDANILAFSQVYDKIFLRQPAKKVVKVPGNLQGLTLVSMYSAKTDQQLFDQHGLIKVGDNLYHKVDLTADISEAYEYLYQQMREGAFQIPYQYRTETNMDNKPAVLQDIAEFVNARETGLGFYNEKASLYQVVFGHPEINLVKESDMATSALSTLTTNEVYLKTDFVSDFYSMILQEKLADSPVYRNTLSKFSVTDNDITLTSDLVSDLTDIPMYQELMDYIKLRKNSSMKKFLPAEMMGDTNEAFSAYNFPTTIAQYTGAKAETQNLVVTPPILDDFIRIEDTVYQKVKVSETANVFLRLKPNNNSAYYTTTPAFTNFTQEQIDRAAQTDMVTNTKLTGKDINARKEKSGVLSRLVNNIKARSASLVSQAQQQATKAFETNLVEFLRQKGLPVVTDLAEMKAALAELGIDSVNQMFRFQDMGVKPTVSIDLNGNKLTVTPSSSSKIKTPQQAYGVANSIFQKVRKYVQDTTGPLFRENMVVREGTTVTLNIPVDMQERVEQMRAVEEEIARIIDEQKQENSLEDYNPAQAELDRGVSPDVLKDLGYNMLQTPAGSILGFEYKGTIYLDPALLNNVTTLHELTHVFQALVKARSNAGDTQAQKILQKREEIFGAMAREWEVFHKTLGAEPNFTRTFNALMVGIDGGYNLNSPEGATTVVGLLNMAKKLEQVYGIQKTDWVEAQTEKGLVSRRAVKNRLFKDKTLSLTREEKAAIEKVSNNQERVRDVLLRIKYRTGWSRGADGQWRYEIEDKDAKVNLSLLKRNRGFFADEMTLEEVLNHPELYDAYPRLRNVEVVVWNDIDFADAQYSRKSNVININLATLPESQIKAKLLHEVQHAIQNLEGFATVGAAEMAQMGMAGQIPGLSREGYDTIEEAAYEGVRSIAQLVEEGKTIVDILEGNYSQFFFGENPKTLIEYYILENPELGEVFTKTEDASKEVQERFANIIISDLSSILDTKPAFDLYLNNISEVEARNVEARLKLTPEERKNSLLQDTEDVARDEQITIENGAGKTVVGDYPLFQVDAYHGTPYSFDRFSTEAIGTGEGRQAFGWGLYFTDLKSIAENYANAVTDQNYFNKFLDAISKSATTNGISLAKVGDVLDLSRNNSYDYDTTQEAAQKAGDDEILRLVQENKEFYQKKSKNLYKVSIHKGKTPSEYTWLIWDKKLSPEVKEKIKKGIENRNFQARETELLSLYDQNFNQIKDKISDKRALNFVIEKFDKSPSYEKVVKELTEDEINTLKTLSDTYQELNRVREILDFDYQLNNFNGNNIYSQLRSILGSSKEASLFLLENGIDGVKYPAESISRGATSDTARGFNYVVFDENAVTIEEVVSFQILGEKGAAALDATQEATFRIDNLQLAREMEQANKTAKEIRLATGWEKGADNLWRYEVLDGETTEKFQEYVKKPTLYKDGIKLQEALENTEIFAAYANLKNIEVVLYMANDGTRGVYDSGKKKIFLNLFTGGANKSNLLHEVQHAIQSMEGFALGGDPATMTTKDEALQFLVTNLPELTREQKSQLRATFKNNGLSISTNFYFDVISDDSNKLEDVIAKLEIMDKAFPNEDYKSVIDALDLRIMEMAGTDVAFEKYKKLAGEVEARNVQTRTNMSPEQRRQTLLSQTEDIAREDQIILQSLTIGFQANEELRDTLGLDLSAPVYAQRQGESDTDYHNRLVNEVEAYVAAPEIAQKLEELRQTNPGLWSRITDFLKNLTTWLKTQIGLSDYEGDIMNMTKEEYTSALGVSILKEEYDDLFVPNNSNKIANEVINATVVLDSQVEMISLQTEEAQDALYNKIDNCG